MSRQLCCHLLRVLTLRVLTAAGLLHGPQAARPPLTQPGRMLN